MTSFIRKARGTADETVNMLTTSEKRLTFYWDRRSTVAAGEIEAGGSWR